VSQCGKQESARGFCNSCYIRKKKLGELKNIPLVNSGKLCKISECKKNSLSLGYCAAHYSKFKKYGDPFGSRKILTGMPCSTKDCKGLTVAKGMCANCYALYKRYGDPTKRSLWFHKRNKEIVDDKGYILVYARHHENATRGSRVAKHRLVMSEYLGRPLRKNENVHHINGDRQDNRLENLELWVTSQPSGQRPLDLIAWAKEILNIYSEDEKKLKKLNYRNTKPA